MSLDLEGTKRLITEEEEAAERDIAVRNAAGVECLRDAITTVRVILERRGGSIPSDTLCPLVAVFLFCKILRTTRAISKLCSSGYTVEAIVLVRSALEALINLLFITQADCEERARLYVEFDHVLAKEYLSRVDRWPALFEGLDLAARRARIAVEFDKIKRKYPNKRFWASKLIRNGGLRTMAQKVGLEWYYDFVYWLASNQVHSNPRSVNEYVEVFADGSVTYKLGLAGQAGPELSVTGDVLIRALECIVNTWQIPEAEAIERLKAAHQAAFGRGDTPITS